MLFTNETKMEAGWTLGFEKDGRELIVVAVKGTFSIPQDPKEEAALAEEQIELTEADEFTGEPGASATLYETDYSPRKPACDVLVNGSAYAPRGRPAERVTVGLHVGPIHKRFDVVGNRSWQRFLLWRIRSAPEKFTRMSISYDSAYGGTDVSEKNPDKVSTYRDNPVGAGYYPRTTRQALIGKPLPNTEEDGRVARRRRGRYRPMSFGAISRNFRSRIPFAGTYDDAWLANRVPLLPEDFDYRYFQAAPGDQQMPYPQGGEKVTLENLTSDGQRSFRIPTMDIQVLFVPYQGDATQKSAVIDTIVIEPDENRFTLTWRSSMPLKRDCFELSDLIVGTTLKEYLRETRTAEKTHYASIDELVKKQRSRRS
jgi:hypothetical protein